MNQLNPRKAVGVDGISSKLLKLSAPVIAEEIAKLINYCIRNQTCPNEWKSSNITPVHKKVEETNKENYWPISILTTVSKVYEKVLHDQMLEAFRDHLSPNISGSLKNHSCCTVLLKMTEDWRSSLDNRETVVAVAIDLSKAFDSINHGLLLAKLQAYSFSHSAVKLITSYLVGHQQRVKVQGTFSTYRTITRGVPQGSILGPVLFNLFINDLNYTISNLSLRIYVDDTTGYASNASSTVLEVVINNDLKTVASWFNANDLAVNNTKSQAISLGARAHNYHFEINDSNIKLSDSLKILGVTMDRRTSPDSTQKDIFQNGSTAQNPPLCTSRNNGEAL